MVKQAIKHIAEQEGCPRPLARQMDDFLDMLSLERSLSFNTRDNYYRDLRDFALWLGAHGVVQAADINVAAIMQFLQEQKQGLPLPVKPSVEADKPGDNANVSDDNDNAAAASLTPRSAATVARRMSAIRGFFRYLNANGLLDHDPSQQLRASRGQRPWPYALDQAQVQKLLGLPDNSRPLGRRDQALLELCYGCGLRVSELVGLSLHDIDLRQGLLRVLGKGDKQRVVPVGEYAQQALNAYLQHDRQLLLRGKQSQRVFVNGSSGGDLTRSGFFRVLRAYGRQIGCNDLHPHALRHSAASHMLQNGADLRVVQEFLGHSDISTTQIYTSLERSELKGVYNRCHPRSGYSKGEDKS